MDVNAGSVVILLCTSGSPVTSRGVGKENVGAVTAQQYVTGEKIVDRFGNIMPGSSQKIKLLIRIVFQCE